jgi:hypothetical protein
VRMAVSGTANAPLHDQRLPPADGDRLSLAPPGPDLGGGVTECGVHQRVDDYRPEKAAHDGQECDVEGAQPQCGLGREGPVGNLRQGDRVGEQCPSGGVRRARGYRYGQELLADLDRDPPDSRLNDAGRQPHAKRAGTRVGQELNRRLDRRSSAGARQPGNPEDGVGEPRRDGDGRVGLPEVHL